MKLYQILYYNTNYRDSNANRDITVSSTNVRIEGDLEQVLEALEDVRMGRVVDGDKVYAWLESWGTEDELPAPIE